MNITAIKTSLESDEHVSRWFEALIDLPPVRAELSGNDTTAKLYQEMDAASGIKRLTCVHAISLRMIEKDIAGESKELSLYGLCERYSRKYGVPGLVDKLFARDYLRSQSLIALGLAVGISAPAHSSTPYKILLIALLSTAILTIAYLPVFYRRLK
jgi:hypothetical protein